MLGKIGLALAVLLLFAAMAYKAQSQEFQFGFGPPGYEGEHHHQYWPGGPRRWHPGGGHWGGGRGECRELRAACIHKEELGEVGQGNCQRYREECR